MADQAPFRSPLPIARRRSYDDNERGIVPAELDHVNPATGRNRSQSESFTSSTRFNSVNDLLLVTGTLESDFESKRKPEYYRNIVAIYRHAHLTHAGSSQITQRLGSALLHLGISLRSQYRAESQEFLLCQAIEALREACELVSGDKRSESLNALGHCLRLRNNHFGDTSALKESLLLHEAALELTPPGHPNRSRTLYEVGSTWHRTFQCSGDVEHLKSAIDFNQAALLLRPPGHPDRIESLNNLCVDMFALYEPGGSVRYLNEAIQFGREAVSLGRAGHPEFCISLNSLAASFGMRYEATSAVRDLEDACSILDEAMTCFPTASNSYSVKTNLAFGLLRLSQRTSSVSALKRSISISAQTIQSTPRQHSSLATTLAIRASSFRALYLLTGSNVELEEAIRIYRELLELCDPVHRLYGKILSDLSGTLLLRYSHRGSVDDLDEAVQLSNIALKSKFTRLRQFPVCLLHYVKAAELAAQNGRMVRNLDEVIPRLQRLAFELSPDDHSKILFLIVLGQALRWRYEHNGKLRDINDAMDAGARASATVSAAGADDRSTALYEHAQTCLTRFHHLGNIQDLQLAYDNLVDALPLRPVGHPDRVEILVAMFFVYSKPAAPMHDPKQALYILREAANDVHASAGIRLRLATGALSSCSRTMENHPELLDSLLDIYRTVIYLMQRAALVGFTLRHQISFLRNAESIASEAGQCAFKCSKSELAIELLEEGRATFWSHSLRLRTPFDDLPKNYREQLQSLTRAINAGLFNAQFESCSKAVQEEQARLRRQQREQVERILEEVRQIPGFGQLLLPPSFSMLAHASSFGPVVLLTASKSSCMALSVNPGGDVQHVPLPSISAEGLEEMCQVFRGAMSHLQRGRRRRGGDMGNDADSSWPKLYESTRSKSAGVLRALWENVVRPVLVALRIQRSEGQERPRLWWCQTGPFTFLPIHAAGSYADETYGTDCCANYVVSSYTPTLKTLLQAREGFSPIPHEQIRVLLAAVPNPFEDDWMELPGTRREVRQLKVHIPSEMLLSLPIGDDASIDDNGGASIASIEANVQSATILHLSSHGWQNPDDPLSSGFVMRDGMLTVERLMGLSLPNAFLAFLSACETAKGDQKQPNQVIHLAAAMLFTGFRSVVGTMWSIDEDDGVFVATEFHRRLLDGSKQALDAANVAYALDEAIRKLRERDNHPGRWASYVHFGI